ncbi:MAG: recombination mediator RecR [Gammaproteobacteria bacterium]|nr:recombination mediator RecR [Gammaproteobacteria bacterium]
MTANVFPPRLAELLEALKFLPGVGPRSAERMVLHMFARQPEGARRLARSLAEALTSVRPCSRCGMLADGDLCLICQSTGRDPSQLCVVESPSDLAAVESSGAYRGLFFVLSGRLSPLDGIGPEELGLEKLEKRLDEGVIRELILATSATVEGEATAAYLGRMAHRRDIKATRIAQGVPLGGELSYVDSGTLSSALAQRRQVD